MGLNYKKLHGRGRLVPMRPTGIGYQVRHGIKPVAGVAQFIGTALPVPRDQTAESFIVALHKTPANQCSVEELNTWDIIELSCLVDQNL